MYLPINTTQTYLYFFIASGAVRRRTTETDITCSFWDLANPTCGWCQDPNDDFDGLDMHHFAHGKILEYKKKRKDNLAYQG
mgnify:CR=1 FL=1